MGPTWPNLGPRCAPDSLTLLNIGPTKSQRERERGRETGDRETERERGTSPAHTQTQIGRRPAVRRKPHKSGRRPRARSLAGGLRLVTEGYIRSPPLPPTLLFDRGDTPARPPTKSARQIYMYLALDVRKMCKNIVFYRVWWPSASTTGCPWCQLCVPRGQA